MSISVVMCSHQIFSGAECAFISMNDDGEELKLICNILQIDFEALCPWMI